jgi:hypothetical protein
MAKREMGTTFIFLVHFQVSRLSDCFQSGSLPPIKAPFPFLPLACFGTVLEESEGKWEGDFSEAIFVYASSDQKCSSHCFLTQGVPSQVKEPQGKL